VARRAKSEAKAASPTIMARYNALGERLRKRTGVGLGVWLLVLLVVASFAWLFLTQERSPAQ
jgi:hypothetical protein